MRPIFVLTALLILSSQSYGQHHLMRLNPDNTIDSFKVSDIHNLHVFRGELYFYGYTDSTGEELFVLKGDSSAVPLTNMSDRGKKIFDFTYSYWGQKLPPPKLIVNYNGMLYFDAVTRDTTTNIYGNYVDIYSVPNNCAGAWHCLWEYNGIDSPEIVTYNIGPDTFAPFFPHNLSIINNKLFFETRFRLDEKPKYPGPFLIYDAINDTLSYMPIFSTGDTSQHFYGYSNNYSNPISYNDKIYFPGSRPGHKNYEFASGVNDLVVYDSSKSNLGFHIINKTSYQNSCPQDFVVFHNKLFFTATDRIPYVYGRYAYSDVNFKLYMISGNNSPLKVTEGDIVNTHVYKNNLYVSANKSSSNSHYYQDYELFVLDTTISGGTNNTHISNIKLIKEINPYGSSYPANFYNHLGKMYFSADDGIHGNELWVYDAVDTPSLLADIHAGIKGSRPGYFTTKDSFLYFAVNVSRALDSNLHRNDIETIIEKEQIPHKLYPNPTHTTVHLLFELKEQQTLAFTLTDVQGKVVYRTTKEKYSIGNHTIDIPTYNIPPGTYIYQLKSEQGILGGGQLIKQ